MYFMYYRYCILCFAIVYFSDMAENTISWTETVNSPRLQTLLGSFQIEIPEDPQKLSFAKGLLEASEVKEFVEEIKSLAKNVVLCKHITKDEDIRPGTVYVYEVDIRYRGNHVVIDDKVIWCI